MGLLLRTGINILLMGIYILVTVVRFFMTPMQEFIPEIETMEENKKEQYVMASRAAIGVIIGLFAFAEFLNVWFQCVVYRAYKYMKMAHSSVGTQTQT
ncbi:hypothetical protein DdX_13333 [Ditylenchus destructor]|uniref:Uncharacterized protein n=1 Tax=Ditylenchus destructor TaxID=166010 RepID=A0AAD4R2P5_9BILA|nr:hypothetical protein DdX_13333 [Ditylenchus destructor]